MSGSGAVVVVTDSTAYLPAGLADARGVRVVPLQVLIDGRVGEEGTDILPGDVAAALSSRRTPVGTSRPSPDRFARAYADAAAAGATAVVSVHLSAALSGTVEAARLAAQTAAVPVRVVDSRSTGMGLGFAVLAAAEVASSGADEDATVAAATETARQTAVLFYVDTLEHLRRGGRIGHAAAMVGSALAVKPILHVDADGRIAPLEKVRTSSRALARLEDLAAERAGDGPVDVAVHHLATGERAEALADRLRERLGGVRSVHICEVGAAIGAHVGPGLLAVVIAPAR